MKKWNVAVNMLVEAPDQETAAKIATRASDAMRMFEEHAERYLVSADSYETTTIERVIEALKSVKEIGECDEPEEIIN